MSSTTPRSQIATAYPFSQTPSRRVLGDIAAKAINTPSYSTSLGSSQVTQARNPLKHLATQAPLAFWDKENHTNLHAHSQGTKRNIDEVDSAEVADHLKMLARGRGDSLMGAAIRLTTDAMHLHSQNNPVDLVNRGSPTECNTPSPEPEIMQDSQKINQSFSDLLDYRMCASLKSEHGIPLDPTPVPTAIEARKARAEQLRTRLKFGLYKLTTNQIGKRDADIIDTYEAHLLYPSNTRTACKSTPLSSYIDSRRVPNITISSPQCEQDIVLVKANLDPFCPINKLGAAPVVFLPPSSLDTAPHQSTTLDLSSSPPSGVVISNSASPQQLPSTVQQNPSCASQMCEYDDTDINSQDIFARGRLQRLKEQQYLENDVTINAVKGNAAKGLLELMYATR